MTSSTPASFPMGTADGLPETEKNAGESENTYILRPIFQQRFRPSVVKECIHAVLKEELANAEYSPEEMPQLTKRLSETIKDKLKEMGFDRYKVVVQVVIGEQRGEGVFMAARCFWDADTDNYTHDVFMNVPASPGGARDRTMNETGMENSGQSCRKVAKVGSTDQCQSLSCLFTDAVYR
ncbi:dynein light chain Tctex-type protein 2B isoform X1 [Ursus americanus]|uniref:Dynein light chain Tctex-type protein 2B isoform X1 n=1 Tax=Ursus maritimus TaxID=29073 RepID=A0A384DIJ1_URSMA|nr:dynein light chain Tctex-type protein 2B isoform X1 [Ursus maritimus]XP_045668513.1 dynein light chain Tctex-type protein 2B isoform X1 [Ursus americanus]XP_048070904.1 dynein light chain Tctex-type protein 2B isoform X2 [Ursus arctos]